MAIEWDPQKAEDNFAKHGVRFAEAPPVFEDDYAIVITDDESDQDETRFVALGTGAVGRVLVVVYCYRGENIRIISVRLATPHERRQ
jgi:uncharacterized DUF497 family protein